MAKTRPDFDWHAESYERELDRALLPGAGEGIKYSRIKADHLRRQLGKAFGPQARPSLLDAGCGIGITDEFLKRFFPALAGFDVSPKSVHLAKQRNPQVQYKTSDGKVFPFADGEFDAVFAICVLHHVPPQERDLFFNETYRVLRPGGYFFLYEHNPWNPLTRLVVGRCPFDRDAALLSPKEGRRLLKQGGFNLIGSGHLIFLPLESAGWMDWEERWLSKIPAGTQFFLAGKK